MSQNMELHRTVFQAIRVRIDWGLFDPVSNRLLDGDIEERPDTGQRPRYA